MMALTLVVTPLVLAQGMDATLERLEQRIASVLPKPEEECWLKIPWRTNLLEARAEAQRVGKPLFLWIMNGNPQGCT